MDFFVFVSVCVFSMWPKITLLRPVWPRCPKSLETPAKIKGLVGLYILFNVEEMPRNIYDVCFKNIGISH